MVKIVLEMLVKRITGTDLKSTPLILTSEHKRDSKKKLQKFKLSAIKL